jgi:phosphoserine phosphatase RsbU/P
MTAAVPSTEHRNQRLRMLTEVSRALTLTVSIEEVLQIAVERAAELMSAEKALIMLADADGLLVVRAAYGVDPERVQSLREPLNETLVRRLQELLDYQVDEAFLSVPLVAQGQVTGLLAAVRAGGASSTDDEEWLLSALADQAAVALEHAKLSEEVHAERNELERMIEAQSRVHATLGHEVRSPLTAIQSYAALLLDGLFGKLNDRQRESVSRIRVAGKHLLAIMENILDTARLGTGGILLSCRNVPVGPVVAESIEMLQLLAAEKHQELYATGNMEMLVWADPNRLRQALVNLIGNAIKYTPPGGSIQVEVSASIRKDRPFCAVAVKDTGPGIPREVLPTLFRPYVRGGTAGPEPGLGLGLYISRELVRQMEGEIEVMLEPGAGATFTVYVPIAGNVEREASG